MNIVIISNDIRQFLSDKGQLGKTCMLVVPPLVKLCLEDGTYKVRLPFEEDECVF